LKSPEIGPISERLAFVSNECIISGRVLSIRPGGEKKEEYAWNERRIQ
jgi:hypothetical protein